MVATIERVLHAAFSYDKINYLMLMMNDPHVHFHVMPRYASERTFAGRSWKDAGWPALPVLGGDAAGDDELTTIREELRRLA
jgi:diadenosine tetraphosphate (Ap4A) HIT family hydrolase